MNADPIILTAEGFGRLFAVFAVVVFLGIVFAYIIALCWKRHNSKSANSGEEVGRG